MEVFSEGDLSATLASPYITVGQIIDGHILTCDPQAPLYAAAELMSESGCSSIIVTEGEKPVGIWTERDALAIDFSSESVLNSPVSTVMSQPVKSIPAETTLQEVASRFLEQGIRHYLVASDEGTPLGVVSQTDVVLNQGIEHYLRMRNVDSVLKQHTSALEATTSLDEAAAQMRKQQCGALLIDYGEGEYGILTERDIVRLIARRMRATAVGDLASRPLLAVESDCSLYRARGLLVQHGIRHLGVRSASGEMVGLISFSDILFGMEHIYVQELQQALAERDQALNTSRRHLHLAEKVIESSLEGIIITNAQGVIESVNPAFSKLTGYSAEEAVGQTPAMLSSGRHDAEFYTQMWQTIRTEGHWQGEVWNRRKSGEIYPELLTIAAIHDEQGALTHYAALFSDISELKENEERIRNLAYYDALTGLPNRRLFQDRLSVAINHSHRHESVLAVIFVDLDRFKRINDSLGHAMGDLLLQEVAERLLRSVREEDTVARMGGDEFIILLNDAGSVDTVVQVARRIIREMERPVQLGERELVVTCSLGISLYPDDGDEIEQLIQNADTAMYRAKEGGRNSYQLYSPEMNAHSLEHLALEAALRKALEQDELTVHFQPLVHTNNETLAGAEALVRWQNPTLGLVPPSDFIPLAEETGLIVPIGEFVLRRVCEQIRQWQLAGYGDVTVAVNVSAVQFRSRDFIAATRKVLDECATAPELLCFELTESMLVEDAVDNIRTMNALREMGVRLAVDDFGTGYSSLNYLRRFPIDKLKIDRAFIRDIDHKSQDQALISAVIHLGHSLGLEVVAEGVERLSQVEMLRQQGCDLLQGFYFNPGLEPEAFASHYLIEGEDK